MLLSCFYSLTLVVFVANSLQTHAFTMTTRRTSFPTKSGSIRPNSPNFYSIRSPHNFPVVLRDVVAGVGDEGCQIRSISGVNMQPNYIQTLVVLTIVAGLAVSITGLNSLFDLLFQTFPVVEGWKVSWPVTLGPIYTLAGVSHFTIKNDFCNIMPAKGAWGFWYLPGSKEFHVLWTGVAETLFGLGLTLGGACSIFGWDIPFTVASVADAHSLIQYASLGLLVLTSLVTPANIYMYTHGAKLPINGPEVCDV